MIITAGSTNRSVDVYFVDDDGGVAPGEPHTGLLFSDIETGGSASYHRQGAARVDFTLITLASASATHADGGFILIDDSNMPGLYRADVPDAAFATGADYVVIQMVAAGANNTIMRPLLIDLTEVDLRDSVRGGMTALPNAAADAAGGLIVSDVGGLDADVQAASVTAIEVDTSTTLQAELDAIQVAVITNAAGIDIAADIAVIESQTDDIGVAGAGLTNITINTASVDAVKDAILPVTNTALNNLVFFMADDTDHVSAVTGLTITTTRSIDGGAFGSGTGTSAEIANGTYQYDASAADMNGTNIMFRFTGTDADDTFIFVRTGG